MMFTKEKTDTRQKRVQEAREKVKAAKARVKDAKAAADEQDRAMEEAREQLGGNRPISFPGSPSPVAVLERDRTAARSELEAAERTLELAQQRLAEAERQARPLSPMAARRLQEMVDLAAATEELAERGIDGSIGTPRGRQTLIARAAEFGVTPTE